MDIKKSLVTFSYTLASSQRYQEFKGEVRELLEDASSSKKRYFDIFMIVLVLVTILILIFEIKHELQTSLFICSFKRDYTKKTQICLFSYVYY